MTDHSAERDPEAPVVLTVDQAAELLQFTPSTVRALARKGEIPGKQVGGQWRFSRRQLLEWVETTDSR